MAAPEEYDNAGGLVARSAKGDNAEPLTISEISSALKRTVEDRFGFVRLRGELSGVKRAASGHMYCSLKDENAVIDAVMWRGNAGRLAFRPEDGIEVIASGKITTYPGRSKYQIVVDSMEIAGEGALLALLEKTKARLEAEGLFARERKREIPYLPKVIGVVTSPTGSVIRDILHRLEDRFPSHVLVWPVLVQGQGAAEQVAQAIHGFSALSEEDSVPRPDLVIVARGGGSIEDLWSFNEEVVVRAIAECSIPVISAVGHETDTTLADYAADRRAPTPTAAAEMAVPVRTELIATVADFGNRQRRAVYRPIEMGRERLDARVRRLPQAQNLLQPQAQRLDELSERLRRGLMDRAATGRDKLTRSAARLSPRLLEGGLRDARRRLDGARLQPALVTRPIGLGRDRLDALWRVASQFHPEKPLERGYAIVRDADGNALTGKAAAEQHDRLVLQFRDGKLSVLREGADASPSSPPPPPRPASSKPRRSKPSAAGGTPPVQDDLFG